MRRQNPGAVPGERIFKERQGVQGVRVQDHGHGQAPQKFLNKSRGGLARSEPGPQGHGRDAAIFHVPQNFIAGPEREGPGFFRRGQEHGFPGPAGHGRPQGLGEGHGDQARPAPPLTDFPPPTCPYCLKILQGGEVVLLIDASRLPRNGKTFSYHPKVDK